MESKWNHAMIENCHLKLKVSPGAKSNQIIGFTDGLLKLKIKARPEKGKANDELVGFLGKKLGVPKSDILITNGLVSKNKSLLIKGISCEVVLKRLDL